MAMISAQCKRVRGKRRGRWEKRLCHRAKKSMLSGQKTKNYQTHALKVLILKKSPNFKFFANLQTTHIIKIKLNIML